MTGAEYARNYMKELGIRPARDSRKFVSQMESAIGITRTKMLIKLLSDRANGYQKGCLPDNDRFYREKNQDYWTSITMSCASEGENLEAICCWLYENKAFIQGDVLEIGCDNGIVSCFLGKLAPNSRILAIDRCPEAIEVARKLALKLNVENVEFRCMELSALQNDSFDAVLSCRVMHENNRRVQAKEIRGLEAQAEMFRETVQEYGERLAGLVKTTGCLLSVERMEQNAMLLGWMMALNHVGLSAQEGSYAQLEGREMGNRTVFQALHAVPRAPIADSDVKALFSIVYQDNIDLTRPEWKSWLF